MLVVKAMWPINAKPMSNFVNPSNPSAVQHGIGQTIYSALAIVLTACASHESPEIATPPPLPASIPAPAKAPLVSTDPTMLDSLFPVGQFRPMFDGRSLHGWKISDFAGGGEVRVEQDLKGAPAIVCEQGAALTGISWTNAIPKMDYEVELDAMKLLGSDFLCGLTFPFGESFCTFVCGGWGGAVVGISSVDGQDASQNETTKYIKFDENRWYHLKVRVTKAKIETWIDSEKIVDLDTTGKKIDLRFGEIAESVPFGLAAYQTRAAWRNITLRRLAK